MRRLDALACSGPLRNAQAKAMHATNLNADMNLPGGTSVLRVQEWKGSFYPKGPARQAKMLRISTATRFGHAARNQQPLYRMPKGDLIERLAGAERSAEFKFILKNRTQRSRIFSQRRSRQRRAIRELSATMVDRGTLKADMKSPASSSVYAAPT